MNWKGQLWFWALTLAWVGIVAALFAGCAAAPPRVDWRALDLNGCLLDVERRADGSLHQSWDCEGK